MFILMPVIFVLGILAIALEDKIKINKSSHSVVHGYLYVDDIDVRCLQYFRRTLQYDLSRVLDPESGDGQLAPA